MQNKQNNDLWLPGVVSRICTFLFVFALMNITLYLAGNFQKFLDSSQLMLMRLFEQSAILQIIATAYYLLLIVSSAVRGRPLPIIRAVVLSAAALSTGILLGIVRFISVWIEGYAI